MPVSGGQDQLSGIEERVGWPDRSLSPDGAAESPGRPYRECNQVSSERRIGVRLRRADDRAASWPGISMSRTGRVRPIAPAEFRPQDSAASGAKAGSFSTLLRTASAPYSNICRS
jgi:hypothetical protein